MGTNEKTADAWTNWPLTRAPDRHQILLDGAKAEGKIVWYTSLSGVYRELVDAFKRKYPDIAIDVYRGGSNDLTPRIINEAQAGRPVADALESTPGLLMALRDRGLLKPYVSPELAKYPDEAKSKADGARVFWVTDREAYMGFGYNTRMIAPAEVPKNFQDLLRPELKGKLAVTTESSTSRVIGTMIKVQRRGIRQAACAAQEMRLFKASSAGFLDLIAAGEVARIVRGFSQSSGGQEGARARRWIGCRSTSRRPMPAARRSSPTRPIRTRRCCSPISSSAPKGKN